MSAFAKSSSIGNKQKRWHVYDEDEMEEHLPDKMKSGDLELGLKSVGFSQISKPSSGLPSSGPLSGKIAKSEESSKKVSQRYVEDPRMSDLEKITVRESSYHPQSPFNENGEKIQSIPRESKEVGDHLKVASSENFPLPRMLNPNRDSKSNTLSVSVTDLYIPPR